MAVSLGKQNILWFRRCCLALGGATKPPCSNPAQPYGSYDMRYYAEIFGDYTPGVTYDTYSNLRVHFWLETNDYGYSAMCPSENGGYSTGCTGVNGLYYNTNANGENWQWIWEWDPRYNIAAQDVGEYKINGNIVVPAGKTVYFTVARSFSCGKFNEPLQIKLSKPQIDYTKCTSPTIAISCGPSAASPSQGTITMTGTWGENINKTGQDVAVNTQTWYLSPGGRTGSSSTITGLQPNSSYSVYARRSNGCASATSNTCSFTTLCGNTLSNCRSLSSTEIAFDCTIDGGYGVYEPTTGFRYRASGELGWHTIDFTTKTKTKTTVTISGLTRETYYEIQGFTTTAAGTYYGNTIICQTAAGIYANVDSSDPKGGVGNSTCDVCYSWRADCSPVTTQLYYRVKNGFDDTWLKAPEHTSNDKVGSHCVTLTGLVPNYTVYECYVHAEGCDGEEYDSNLHEFTTPAMEKPDNYNCDNLEYMRDLICQALEAIKHGNKTIYANQASKDRCDPYSENPTMTTFWSRFFRWGGAAACLLCDMADFLIKSGKKDQYLVGEIGWVNTLTEIQKEYAEDDDEGNRLPQSQAVYRFIKDSIHEVWHYHGAVDYIVNTQADAPADAKVILVLEDNTVYEKSGSSWKKSTTIDQPDDFSVYHVNYETEETTIGYIKPESAWYYFEGTWNNLDANVGEFENRLAEMEEAGSTTIVNTGDDKGNITMRIVDENFDLSTLPEGRNICFITEENDKPEPVYHTVKFVTKGGTVVNEQKVLHGAMAQLPTIVPAKNGCLFGGWVKEGDVAPDCRPVYQVDFDTDGGSANPPSQIVWGGDYFVEPPEPTKPGFAFAGWYVDGEEVPDCGEVLTVEFDAGGKTKNPQPQYVMNGKKIKEPEMPDEVGSCSAGGWYDVEEQEPACDN